MVKLLGFVVADAGPGRAHCLLVGLRQVDDTLHPRQVVRQRPAHGLGLGLLGARRLGAWFRRRFEPGFKLGDQRLELGLVEELELIGGDAIGTGASALAFEQGDVVEPLRDALLALLEGLFVLGALTFRLGLSLLPSHHRGTPREWVVGEGGSGALHNRSFYPNSFIESAR